MAPYAKEEPHALLNVSWANGGTGTCGSPGSTSTMMEQHQERRGDEEASHATSTSAADVVKGTQQNSPNELEMQSKNRTSIPETAPQHSPGPSPLRGNPSPKNSTLTQGSTPQKALQKQ